MRYRRGSHWNVTVIETSGDTGEHQPDDRLVAMATTPEDAARIVYALNAADPRELEYVNE